MGMEGDEVVNGKGWGREWGWDRDGAVNGNGMGL